MHEYLDKIIFIGFGLTFSRQTFYWTAQSCYYWQSQFALSFWDIFLVYSFPKDLELWVQAPLEVRLWSLEKLKYSYVYSVAFPKKGCGRVIISGRWGNRKERCILVITHDNGNPFTSFEEEYLYSENFLEIFVLPGYNCSSTLAILC